LFERRQHARLATRPLELELYDGLFATEFFLYFVVTELWTEPYHSLRCASAHSYLKEYALLDLGQASLNHFEGMHQYLRWQPKKTIFLSVLQRGFQCLLRGGELAD